MIKILHFHCRERGSVPDQGTKIPHASLQGQKQTKRVSSRCCGICRVYTFGQGVSLQKPTLWRYEAYEIRKQQHEWPRGGQGGSAEPEEKAAVVSLGLRSIG